MAETLYLYLHEAARAAVSAGAPRMATRVKEAVEAAGWEVVLLPEAAREVAAAIPGHHMVFNRPVIGPRCLTLRKCCFDPFWRIETTNDRWDWQIAGIPFTGAAVPRARARQFQGFWRSRLFADAEIAREGFVFVPLQGKLTEHRSFQSMSPLAMLEAVLTRWPGVPVRATLHPGETYAPEELAALVTLEERFPMLRLSDEPSMQLLARCNLVVTQNSTLAAKGFFADKPAMLFARIDFQHVAASVPRDGLEAAFAQVESGENRDYPAFLHWYFKENALVFWAGDVQDAIRKRLREHGWPI